MHKYRPTRPYIESINKAVKALARARPFLAISRIPIHGIPASCGFRSESKLTLIFSLVAALPDHLPCPRSYALTIHPFHLPGLKSNKEVKVKIMCLCSRHISTLPPVVLLNIRDGFGFQLRLLWVICQPECNERAGAPESPKNSEYTSLNTEKSSIFARKQVVFKYSIQRSA